MFRFANPEALYLLGLWPVFIVGWWWADRRARQRLHDFTGSRLAAQLTAGNSPVKKFISRLALLLALTSLIFGLARPQAGLMRSEVKKQGLDILFLVDNSRSMEARDIKPSRLGRTKRALFYLVDRLSENRMGLVNFAGVSFVQCPLTRDLAALKLLIDAMDTRNLPLGGTNLGSALDQALEAFARTGARHQVMVIISDGENYGKISFRRLKQAIGQGVRVYCLGVGTPAGEALPGPTAAAAGKPAHRTRLNQELLQRLAKLGEGIYLRLSPGQREVDGLIKELNRLERMELFSERSQIWKDYYSWPLAAALVLLWFELLLGRRRGFNWAWGRRFFKRAGKPAVLIILCWGLAVPGVRASTRQMIKKGMEEFKKNDLIRAEQSFAQARKNRPGDPLAEYNLGCVLLAQYKYFTAYQALVRAESKAQGSLLRDSWYNRGYAAFNLGIKPATKERWLEAAEAFKQVLLLDPHDLDARYNLELILREIKERTTSMARREEKTLGNNQGIRPGGGADKPGWDRVRTPGRENDQAKPGEEQVNTTQRRNKGSRAKTSEDEHGKRRPGMSREDAMRTLRSLEAEESMIQKNAAQSNTEESGYQGPDW